MSKYTPGPWTVQGNRVEAADATTVAAFDKFIEPSAADAALIAAAPDLLEALKGAASVLGLNGCFEAQDRARVAIAKATGEQT